MDKKEAIEIIKHLELNRYSSMEFIEKIIDIINQIDKPQKVVIPRFISEWLEEHKSVRNSSLAQAISRVDYREYEEVFDWLWGKGFRENQLTFARAWIEGYEVLEPKELLYWVRNEEGLSLLHRNLEGEVVTSSGYEIDYQKEHKENYTFTEREIKEYDERYWYFAVPVEEE